VLAFDSTGHGKDLVVVLIHGWPLNRSIWSVVAPRVAAAGFRVLAPDLPGFGDSPPIDFGRATVEAYADEVATFIEPFKARTLAVAGHSFGGYVALALAERRPNAVAGLGLIASRTAADGETARRGRHDTIEKVRLAGTKALLPGLAEKLVGPRGAVEWRPRAAQMIERARPDGVMAALAAMASRPDRTGVFNAFAGPRLVVHGTEDGLIPVSEAARIGPNPLDVRVILDGIGHMPMWEAAEATADAVISWAKSLRR
jgi:pimeloyl-ACP methyl ester carboxylesterase